MYRALYKFVATSPGILSFEMDDQFTVMDSRSSDWWVVLNGQGNIGYVPSNYLTPDNAAVTEVLKSIDRAIEAIQQQAKISGGIFTEDQLHSLRKLQKHRQDVVEDNRLKHASSVHMKKPKSAEEKSTAENSRGLVAKRHAPAPPSAEVQPKCSDVPQTLTVRTSTIEETTSTVDHAPSLISSDVSNGKIQIEKTPEQNSRKADDTQHAARTLEEREPELYGLGHELVEQMRRNTLLSFDASKVAVKTVLTLLASRIPSISRQVDKIMEEMMDNQGADIMESSDGTQMRRVLEELVAAKDDSQQRSWFLHEDEEKISSHLKELNFILDGANPETCCKILGQDGYAACQNLAQYYQMETRRSIRLLLLQSFGSICALNRRFISELLHSVLPLELARDIQNDETDKQKVNYSALVMSMIFSTGEALPLQYYAHLNLSFIDFLLDRIETPEQDVEHEQTVDGFVRLVLALNLHFELPDENIVMKALAARGTAKNFSERLLLMFNREDDPVRLFDHSSNCPNSVIKFVSDIYSRRDTSNLFYTNDAKVLVDIIVRQLTDLSPGDKMRTEYLSLMHLLLKSSQYLEHKHRQSELQLCFQRISQDDKEAEMDKCIVRQIWKEFPNEFYNSL